MKYIVTIILMTLVIIPVLLMDSLLCLWHFDLNPLKISTSMYTNAIKRNWYKLRGVKRPTRF